MNNKLKLSVLAMAAAFAAPQALADTPNALAAPVVVTATRVEQRDFDVAASINSINRSQIQDGQAQANLSEALARVPGIFALNRQNYAQDLLISSRGFGANSTFGVRGIKMFVDGIPATVADGQGQISHIDLASADHIEVMRGPFSALYGNASGGVINVFTENGKPGTEVTPYGATGSYGLHKVGVKVSGEQGKINYVLDEGKLNVAGFRQHSAASRENTNAKLLLKLSDDTGLQIVANRLSLTAQDPLGLNANQLQQDRTQAGSYANAYNARKTVDQEQGGMVLTQRINGDNSLVLSPYFGTRHTVQFQSGTSPLGTTNQANGVIDLSRSFYGMDGKWLHKDTLAGMPLQLVTGLESNRNNDHRLTYDNKAGIQQAPSAASKNQDLSQSANNRDGYVQVELRPSERTTLSAGLRNSETTLNSVSNNAVPGTGSSTYRATTAMASLQHYIRDDTNVYVSWGTGFDTPTLNQVTYSSAYVINNAVANGGNFALQAATTKQLEVGIKSDIANVARVALALFSTVTSNDIVVVASNLGKNAFTNAPQTSRKGIEFSASFVLPWQLQADIAATLLNASVDQAYTSYSGATAVVIGAGKRIPGVPAKGLFGELKWVKADKTLELALEGRAAGNMAANDANGSYAGGYGVMNARIVTRQQSGAWTFKEFARLDNLFDKAYTGSVIVNQKDQQYFEPAPGRNWILGASASYRF